MFDGTQVRPHLLSLVPFLSATLFTVESSVRYNTNNQLMVHFFLAQGTICAAMHLPVTAAIIYGLMKNREGSRRTNRMIDRIIMYVHLEYI
jgi:hypothetical protein